MAVSDNRIKILYFTETSRMFLSEECLLLNSLEFEIVTETDSVLRVIDRYSPDLILMDSGISSESDITCEIHNNPYNFHIPPMLVINANCEPASADYQREISQDINCKDFYHIVHTHIELNKTRGDLGVLKKNNTEKYLLLKESYNDDQEVLKNSLKQIALMLEERGRLLKKLDESEKIKETMCDDLILLLTELIEKKQSYHGGHSKKVADITEFIVHDMGFDKDSVKTIKSSAFLHELGKLMLPDEITQKQPRDYKSYEQNFINQHPVNGAELLSKIGGFSDVAAIVRQVHENVDGTGYPAGLKKNDIHMGARIIKMVSAYENLMRGTEKFTVHEVLKKIEKNVGLLYDSSIIHPLNRYISQQQPGNKEDVVNEISLYSIQAGMVLSSGIYTKDGAKLLPADTILTEEWIIKISEYNGKEPLRETVFIKR